MSKTLLRCLHRFPLLSALVFGGIGALGFAPLYWWPLTVLSLTGFYLLIHKAHTLRVTAYIGFAYGFGLFAACLWWMGSAFRFTGTDWGLWLAPLAIGALVAYMSLFTALTAALWHRFGRQGGAVSFAALWLLAEVLRGSLFYGFPWGYIGYALADSPALMAPAALGGVWLLGALMALLGAALTSRRQSLLAIILIAIPYLYAPQVQPQPSGDSIPLTLVQTNVAQGEKWRPDNSRLQLGGLMANSLLYQPGYSAATIWPETALPITSIQPDGLVSGLAQQLGVRLITGVVRAEMGDELQDIEPRFFNSLVAAEGDLPLQMYDKALLVPFGEFMPLSGLWPKGVRNLVQGGLSFTAGQDVPAISITEKAAATPLICYEATFPDFVLRHSVGNQLLLNITNDGWFNGTTGPAQHMAMARLRAVETGLPLVRVANQGITTVIDGLGRVIYRAPHNKAAAHTVSVPLSKGYTPLQRLYQQLTAAKSHN